MKRIIILFFTKPVVAIGFIVLLNLIWFGLILWIAIHFISKYW